MAIISSKSKLLSNLLHENIANKSVNSKGKVVIDFGGQVLYQAFKKIIDFCYLDDLNVLTQISDSTEMIEMIKLANQFKLSSMVQASESFFQEHMIHLLESNSTCLSIKRPSKLSITNKQKAPTNTENSNKDPNITKSGSRGTGAPQLP